MKQNNMLAMILAGGRGSRLHELTNKVAKPAVSYGGKYRIVDFPLSNCANSGIDIVGLLSMNLFCLTAMSLLVDAGDSMQEKAAYLYFLPARRLTRIWMYTVELQMRFHRILILLITMLRSMF